MGGQRKTEPKQRVQLDIPRKDVQTLDQLAKMLGTTRADLIRLSILEYLRADYADQ